jgi:hypothetical protein
MNAKLLIAWIAVFVAWMVGSFLVHGTLLHGDYGQLPHLFRTEADSQAYFPLMLLAHVMMAAALVWIYSRGVTTAPWAAQGLRFGFAVAFLKVVPTYLIYYVVQPLSKTLVAKQVVFDGALMVLLGLVVAALVRAPRSG